MINDIIRVGDIISREKVTGVVYSVTTTDCDEEEFVDSIDVRWCDGMASKVDYSEVKIITKKIFVNTYLEDKAYGGPEEGGWWYNTWTIIESKKHLTQMDAEAAMLKVEENVHKENDGRFPIDSMASQGIYRAYLEAWPGESGSDYSPWC